MELLSVKDLSEITVTELTERAGINRKTFYLHYDRIEDIITELGQDLILYSNNTLKSCTAPDGSLNTTAIFAAINRTVEENLEFFRLFVRSGTYHFLKSSSDRKEYMNGIRAHLVHHFKGTDMLGPYVIEFICKGVSSMYTSWLSADLPTVSLEELSLCAAHLARSALDRYEEA